MTRGIHMKGRKHSKETRRKMSAAKKGKIPKNLKRLHKTQIGKNNPRWKGSNVGYQALHDWIRKLYGTPKFCENCGTTTAKKYEWACVGIYNRRRKNWKRICTRCHMISDGRLKKHLREDHVYGEILQDRILEK